MRQEDMRESIRNASHFRTAVRVYNDQKIPHEDMELLLDIAHQSPSSVGLEGWRFLVADNQQLDDQLKASLKAIAWGAQPQFETASHVVFLLAEKHARYDSESMRQSLVRRGIDDAAGIQARLELYKAFQERDLAMADDERALFDWTGKQTYIAMGNMMFSAALLGIDSCPIEGFHQTAADRLLDEAGLIDATKEGLVSMIFFGYRLRDPKHEKTRKPREAVVSWLTK